MDFTRSSPFPFFSNDLDSQAGPFPVPKHILASILSGLPSKSTEPYRNSSKPHCPTTASSSVEIRPSTLRPPCPPRREESVAVELELNGLPEPPHTTARARTVALTLSALSGHSPAIQTSAPPELASPASGDVSPPISAAGLVAVCSNRPPSSPTLRRRSAQPWTTGPPGIASSRASDPSHPTHGRRPLPDGVPPKERSPPVRELIRRPAAVPQPPRAADHILLGRPTSSATPQISSTAVCCAASTAGRLAGEELTGQRSTPGQPSFAGHPPLSSCKSVIFQTPSCSVPPQGTSSLTSL